MENLKWQNQKSPKILNRFLLNFYNTYQSSMTGLIYRKCKFSLFRLILICFDLFELALSLINAKSTVIAKAKYTSPRGHTNHLIVSNLLATWRMQR